MAVVCIFILESLKCHTSLGLQAVLYAQESHLPGSFSPPKARSRMEKSTSNRESLDRSGYMFALGQCFFLLSLEIGARSQAPC